MSPRLVLASASPRRLELLRAAGYVPLVVPADVDETPDRARAPEDDAVRLARAKALAIAPRFPEDVVLAADTIVVVDGRLLGKPVDAAGAADMLRRLAGREHRVVTAVHVAASARGPASAFAVSTTVGFGDLDDAAIAAYLSTGEWQGKAGAYAVQGHAAAFTRAIVGSYTNVVGLPLFEVVEALKARGLQPRHDGADPR